jgi:hypothetical protein
MGIGHHFALAKTSPPRWVCCVELAAVEARKDAVLRNAEARHEILPRYHSHAKVCIQPTRGRVSSLFLRLARYIA